MTKSAKYEMVSAEVWPVTPDGTGLPVYVFADPSVPDWLYILELANDGTVASLAIKPKVRGSVPPGGISTRMLARLRLGEMREAVENRIRLMSKGEVPDHADWAVPDDVKRWAHSRLERARQPGRPREVDLKTLLRAAKIYSEANEAPLEAVRAGLNVSYSTARDRIRAARREELLPATRRGVVSSMLTPKARQLLKELDEEKS